MTVVNNGLSQTGDDGDGMLGVPNNREANMDALTGNDTAENSTLTDQQKQDQLDEVNAQRRANGLSEFNSYEDFAAEQEEFLAGVGATAVTAPQVTSSLIPDGDAHASELVRDGLMTREEAESMGFTLDDQVIASSDLGDLAPDGSGTNTRVNTDADGLLSEIQGDNHDDFVDEFDVIEGQDTDGDEVDLLQPRDQPQQGGIPGPIIIRGGISTSFCDDDDPSGTLGNAGGTAPDPSMIDFTNLLPNEFIFDQLSSAVSFRENFGPLTPEFDNAATGEFFSKLNIMIPQQYYYDDIVGQNYDFSYRNEKETEMNMYNFGSLATHLADPFRYLVGGVYNHQNTLQGQPMTFLSQVPEEEAARIQTTAQLGFSLFPINQLPGQLEVNGQVDRINGRSYIKSETDPSLEVNNNYTTQIIVRANKQSLNYMNQPSTVLEDLDRMFITNYNSNDSNSNVLNYIRNNLNTEDFFYDHTFVAPAAFDTYTLQTFQGLPGASTNQVVNISSFAVRPESQSFLSQNLSETRKASIYREHAMQFGIEDDETGNLITPDFNQPEGDYLDRTEYGCSPDLIQKFPQNKLLNMRSINRNIKSYFSGYSLDASPDTPSLRSFMDRNITAANKIEFRMSHKADIADLFSLANIDILLFELIDNTSPSNSTYYTQILDSVLNNYYNPGADTDLAAVNLRPEEYQSPITSIRKMLDFQTFANQPPYSFSIDTYSYPRTFTGYHAYRSGNFEQTSLALRDKIKSNFESDAGAYNSLYEGYIRSSGNYPTGCYRSLLDIYKGKAAYSEVLAYRIEKTDSATGEVLQNFYLMNTSDNRAMDLEFFDTQVISGKKYIYRIFTINIVFGTRYSYDQNNIRRFTKPAGLQGPLPYELDTYVLPSFSTLEPDGDPWGSWDMLGNIDVGVLANGTQDIRIIEAPYYEEEIITSSHLHPPIYPSILPFRSHRHTDLNPEPCLFQVVERKGTSNEQPIYVLDEDNDIINESVRSEYSQTAVANGGQFTEELKYSSFEQADKYQMLYIIPDGPDYEPSSYNSFRNATVIETDSSLPFFDIDLPVNTCIYMIFRSINAAGISNPGPVYKFVNNNHGDGTYTYFDTFELHGDKLEDLITCERLIEINPSNKHLRFNLNSGLTPAGALQAAMPSANQSPEIENINFNIGAPGPDGSTNPRDAAGYYSERGFFMSDTRDASLQSGAQEPTGLEDLLDHENLPEDLLENIRLGVLSQGEAPIWNRSFKFRFRSTTTGNAFDVNVAFDYNKIQIDDAVSEEEYNNCGGRDPTRGMRTGFNASTSDHAASPDYSTPGSRNPEYVYDPDDMSLAPTGYNDDEPPLLTTEDDDEQIDVPADAQENTEESKSPEYMEQQNAAEAARDDDYE